MIKLMIIGRRAPGISRAAAHIHLRDVHGKMVVYPPVSAGAMPKDYVQNHVFDGVHFGGRETIERDLVTELWFDSIDHLRESTATPYYLANLKPDEPRFVDNSTVVKLMVRPDILKEGPSTEFKLFLFMTRNAGATGISGTLAQRLLATIGLAKAVANVAMTPPDGSRPFADVIYEAWYATRADAETALADVGAIFSAEGDDAMDHSRSFALAAEQYDSQRLRDLFS